MSELFLSKDLLIVQESTVVPFTVRLSNQDGSGVILYPTNKEGLFDTIKNNSSTYSSISVETISGALYGPLDRMFADTTYEAIDLSKMIVSEVTSTDSMFQGCTEVIELDLSTLDLSMTTSTGGMFDRCTRLSRLILPNLSKSPITHTNYMFTSCSSLFELDLSNFNTSNVTNMEYMFYGCSSLFELDLSNFNTSNVTNMEYMFYGCSNLYNINLMNFDTSKVQSVSAIFADCSSLEELDLSSFSFYNITNVTGILSGCFDLVKVLGRTVADCNIIENNIQDILEGVEVIPKPAKIFGTFTDDSYFEVYAEKFSDVTSFIDDNRLRIKTFGIDSNADFIESAEGLLEDCTALESVDFSKTSFRSVSSMARMFQYCYNLASVDLSYVDASCVYNMENMFNGCSKLTEIKLPSSPDGTLMYMYSTFRDTKITEIDLSPLNFRNVVGIANMFQSSTIRDLDMSMLDTSNVIYAQSMFSDCTNLRDINLSGFGKGSLVSTAYMFSRAQVNNSYGTSEIIWEDLDTYSIISVYRMFYGSNVIIKPSNNYDSFHELILPPYSLSGLITLDSVRNMRLSASQYSDNLFEYYTGSEFGEFPEWVNMANTQSTSSMFFGSSFNTIDMTNVNFKNNRDISKMFESCSNVTNIKLPVFKNLSNADRVFFRCGNLEEIDLSRSDLSSNVVRDFDNAFRYCSSVKNAYARTQEDCDMLNSTSNKHKNVNFVVKPSRVYGVTVEGDVFSTDFTTSSGLLDILANLKSIAKTMTVECIGSILTTAASLFSDFTELESLDISYLDTSNVSNFSYMMQNCAKLKSVSLSGLQMNTSANCNSMFLNCSSLKSIDLSGCYLDKINNMDNMFKGCSSLVNIRFPEDNTVLSPTSMESTFESCTSLVEIDIRLLNTATITNLNNTFNGCTSVNVSLGRTITDCEKFNGSTNIPSNVVFTLVDRNYVRGTNIDGSRFSYTLANDSVIKDLLVDVKSTAKEIDIFSKTSTSISIHNGFTNFINLEKLHIVLPSQPSSGSSAYQCFMGCSKLTSINTYGLFRDYTENDTDVNVSEVYTPLTSTTSIFNGCSSLRSLVFRKDCGIAILGNMFKGCSYLKAISGNIVRNSGNSIESIVKSCTSMRNIDFMKSLNTSNIKTFSNAFSGCSSLATLDLSNWNFSSQTSTNNMFSGCTGVGNAYARTEEDASLLNLTEGKPDNIVFKTGKTIRIEWSNASTSGVVYSNNSSVKIDIAALASVSPTNIKLVANKEPLTNTSALFYNMSSVERIDISEVDFTGITTLYSTFRGCSNLTEVYLGNNVIQGFTDVTELFFNCSSLVSIDLSGFDFSKTKLMRNMFNGCTSLINIDILQIKTEVVTDIYRIFRNCSSLQKIDMTNINVLPATTDGQAFIGCTSVVEAYARDVEAADTLNWSSGKEENINFIVREPAVYINGVKNACSTESEMKTLIGDNLSSNLEVVSPYGFLTSVNSLFKDATGTIDVSNMDVSLVTNMKSTFLNSVYVPTGLSNWNTANLVNMESIFENCGNGDTSSRVITFNTSKVTNMERAYKQSKVSTSIKHLDLSKVTNTVEMFSGYLGEMLTLEGNFSAPKLIVADNMFSSCIINSVNIQSSDTSQLTSVSGMFSGSTVTDYSMVLNGLNVSKVTNFDSMFSNISTLARIDIDEWDMASAEILSNMFSGCTSLRNVQVNLLGAVNVTNLSNMFSGCVALTAINLEDLTAKINNIEGLFNGCVNLRGVYYSNIDTSECTSFNNLYNGCSNLEFTSANTLNTSNLESMSNIFRGCASLERLNLSNFDTALLVDMSNSFNGCTNLVELNISSINTGTLGDNGLDNAFSGCTSLVTAFGKSQEDCDKYNNSVGKADIVEFEVGGYPYIKAVTSQGDILDYYPVNEADAKSYISSVADNLSRITLIAPEGFYSSVQYLFRGITSLESADISKVNLTDITSLKGMFYGCSSLTDVNLSGSGMSSVTDMSEMYYECTSLTQVNFNESNLTSVTTIESIFEGCSSLAYVFVNGTNLNSLINMTNAFKGCSSLQKMTFPSIQNITSISGLFDGCTSLTNSNVPILDGINMSNITDITSIFDGCSNLTELDLSSNNLDNVVSTDNAFRDCTSVVTAFCSNEETSITLNNSLNKAVNVLFDVK